MNVRQINKTLWALAAAFGAAALIVAVSAFAWRGGEGQAPAIAAEASAQLTQPASSLPPLADLHRISDLPLRQPLVDAPAPVAEPVLAAAPVAPSQEQLPLTLVGTIGTSLAMFKAADGTVELTAVGESTAGVKVLSIQPAKVDVEFNGRSVQLEKPKELSPE